MPIPSTLRGLVWYWYDGFMTGDMGGTSDFRWYCSDHDGPRERSTSRAASLWSLPRLLRAPSTASSGSDPASSMSSSRKVRRGRNSCRAKVRTFVNACSPSPGRMGSSSSGTASMRAWG